MKHTLIHICAAGFIACTAFKATAGGVDAAELAAKYSCNACHAVDHKIVGPGFREIAKKYAGDATAPAKLAAKIKSGGSGTWGSIPMPPGYVSEADMKPLVTWILSLGA